MSITVEIISQGEEIITGQVIGSNSAWLSEQLVALGFQVTRHTTVGDDLKALTSLLQEVSQRATCCICTGGLGPTCDDLTAEAVAQAFTLPLIFDPIAYADIEAFFSRRKRPMPASNRKQALLPQGALRMDNAWGTAPGFAIQQDRCWLAFVPGVPAEMRPLFNAAIRPYLQQHYQVQPNHLVTFKTVGIGESALQELLKDITLPQAVHLGFRAGSEEVQTKLLFPANYPETEKAYLVRQFSAQIGDFVFAVEGFEQPAVGSLVEVIAKLLTTPPQTLAVIESTSQGLIAAKCVAQPWLLESHYQHSLTRLASQFGVKIDQTDLIASAQALAKALQQQSEADFALVQLTAQDNLSANEADQPVILYTVLATAQHVYNQTFTVGGTNQRKQSQAALMALDLLRRCLQHKLTASEHYYA